MTPWPDQPPQTRRQAREHERAIEQRQHGSSQPVQPVPVSRRAATIAPTPAGEVPDVATPYSFASAQRDDASEPRPAPVSKPHFRPRTPHYEDLSFDSLLAASHAGGPANAPAGSASENRAPAAVSFAPAPAHQAGQGVSEDRAKTTPAQPVSSVPYTPAAPQRQDAPALPTVSPVDGHPLTRRELRAMMQARAANDAAQNESSDAATLIPLTPAGPAISAMPGQTSVAGRPGSMSSSEVSPFGGPDAGTSAPSETTRRIVPPAAPARRDGRSVPQTPISAVVTSTSAHAVSPVVIPGVGESDTPDGTTSATGPVTDPRLRARTAGHWSTMNAGDDAGGIRRSAVSTGSVTTANALILPSVPSVGLSNSPLTSTGEVIVTGSIDLPRSLGSTGQDPDHFDSSDIDRLFEESDAAPTGSSVAPVRASNAVATHTSTRGMIAPPRARGNRLPVVLAVTAAFLALGVAALLVAGFVFHAF